MKTAGAGAGRKSELVENLELELGRMLELEIKLEVSSNMGNPLSRKRLSPKPLYHRMATFRCL